MKPLEFLPQKAAQKVSSWKEKQEQIFLSHQKRDTSPTTISDGALTYLITPTSKGYQIKVRHNVTKAILDLTDCNNW